ncbi:MAG: efflux RND transporter permease subunit [Planctomycetota bacterium]|nr:efflux RND transporter permease subunit [Planctomycetota bacterium]
MNPAEIVLKKKTVTVVLSVVIAALGLVAYFQLGRLENPDFVIKTAVISTPYPGASPREVEEEVTDVIEDAVQAMGELKEIRSVSQDGLSIVYADMKNTFSSSDLPQIWDKLRRKVGDIQGRLPPGAGPSIVNDDFGDVYGLFYAICGDGYSFEELKEYAKELKKEILLCQDVAKVAFWGVQTEVIYVEIRHAKMANMGIGPGLITSVLRSQNLVQQSGKVEVDDDYLRITPTGDFTTEEEIANILITDPASGASFRLRDVADVRRGYYDPPRQIMRFNGKPSIALGISTVAGGNAVTMSNEVKERIAELEFLRPAGIDLDIIYDQGNLVTEAVNGFVLNLIESVAIVIVLLLIFMGWRSGLLIGIVLVLTILATFLYMWVADICLQKISLGALIVALGMLVDNAIVVTEGIFINIQKGVKREDAASRVVAQTQWPLFGATVIAVLAFAAIGYAPGNVGEFCRTLFWVLAISLFLSWIFAITVTPLLCIWMLPTPKTKSSDPYDRLFFRIYRRFLHRSIVLWPVTLGAILAAVVAAVIAFGHIPSFFFSDSTSPMFFMDYYRPEGTHISKTLEDMKKIEKYARQIEGVKNVSTFVGQSTLRFYLSYDMKDPNSGFGHLVIEAHNYQDIPRISKDILDYTERNFHDAEFRMKMAPNGPAISYGVEARFRGPDRKVLRRLAGEACDIMGKYPVEVSRNNWRNQVPVFRPVIAEAASRRTGIGRHDVSNALQTTFGGMTVGVYREGEDLIPIIARSPSDLHDSFADARAIQVWSPVLGKPIPLEHVISDWTNTQWEDPIIRRRHRMREITAQCHPQTGLSSVLLDQVRPEIEAMELPPGYTIEWGGEFYSANEAQEPLVGMFPMCLFGMFIILICLFNSIREPIIIFLCLPLIIVGVAFGLLILNLPFGFMAILGLLGLSGMLIKNAIVLIDEIEVNKHKGVEPYNAVLDAAVSRLRPVVMASGTTVLGMTPLIWDPFYKVMAATISSGLIGSTVLTLVVIPLFYKLFYRIKPHT